MSSAIKAPEITSDVEPGRNVAMWEIVSIVSSGLLMEWVVLSFAGKSKVVGAVPVLLALGLMFYSHYDRGETLREIGFRTDNFLAACRLLLLPTALVALLAVAAAWIHEPLNTRSAMAEPVSTVAAVGLVSAIRSQRVH